ncbi:protein gvpG [Halobacteriales archaeon QS_4_69_34]|nr:MAG: protein gvpG [Halobacteriales archaeon QS_4_69_34]
MFLLDDLLVRPFTSLAGIIHAMAIEEMHDTDAIRDDMKENRLLYELGERSEEEYERRAEALRAELDAAEQARERLSGKVEVKGR